MVLRTHTDTLAYEHVGVLLKAPQMLKLLCYMLCYCQWIIIIIFLNNILLRHLLKEQNSAHRES